MKFNTFMAVLALMFMTTVANAQLHGAIQTTTKDGTLNGKVVVNGNVQEYEAPWDVFITGGAPPWAKATAGSLPDDDYYLMVISPSGKTTADPLHRNETFIDHRGLYGDAGVEWKVLNPYHDTSYPAGAGGPVLWDVVGFREFTMSGGSIVSNLPGPHQIQITSGKGKNKVTKWVSFTREIGIDVDHPEDGAINVGLYPFDETPNNGGVYKVVVTPVDRWDPSNSNSLFGFVPRWSKFDVFKVKRKGKKPPPDSKLSIYKKSDYDGSGPKLDANGTELDVNEPYIAWEVRLTDPNGFNTDLMTSIVDILIAQSGDYSVVEEDRDTWDHTGYVVYLNGEVVETDHTGLPEVNFSATAQTGQDWEIVFYNLERGIVSLCKGYDLNANKVIDEGEALIAGFKIHIQGTDLYGRPVDFFTFTGEDGCIDVDMYPGTYTATEILPNGDWINTGPLTVAFVLEPGENEIINFTNYCKSDALQHTKGFWQGPNGCALLPSTSPGINPKLAYLNTLYPYQAGSYYTNGRDNCADEDCDPVTTLPFDWDQGRTPKGELGCFIVAPNSQDSRLQLAQQLAAFTLSNQSFGNSLDSTVVQAGQGSFVVRDLIEEAAFIWKFGSQTQVNLMASRLDGLNNAGTLPVIHSEPCEFETPY